MVRRVIPSSKLSAEREQGLAPDDPNIKAGTFRDVSLNREQHCRVGAMIKRLKGALR